jgi:hypothetical protein
MPVAMPGVSAIKLRETCLSDHEQIARLTLKHGVNSKSFDQWRHVWADNPEYRRQPQWPMGWVLEDSQGVVVGTVGNVPLAYEFEGRRLLAASGRSWVVDEQYRGYATVLMERYFRQKGVDLFINNTINLNAEQAFAAFGSVRVPVGAWDQSSFWITNYPGFAKGALRAKKWRQPALLAWPTGAVLFCKDILKHGPSPSTGEVRLEEGFDERFDDFWNELRIRRSNVLLGVRNSETLTWHFHHRLLRKQVYILTVSERDRIRAYMIFLRRDHHEFGLKRIGLVDYQSLDDDRTIFNPMLAWMLRTCRKEGIDMLEDVGLCIDWLTPPHHRALPSWSFCYKGTTKALAGKLAEKAAWWPTLFDGDATL